jgi:O-antigen/teichoic acid export membrane protein
MSLRRNTVYNLIGQSVPLIAALATIPTLVQVYGDSRYGVLVLGLLLATYFGLMEFGLSHAVAQRLASLPAADIASARCTLTTGFWATGALGTVGGLLAFAVGIAYFSSIDSQDSKIWWETVLSMGWLVVLVPLTTLGAVLSAALQAEQRFVELNAVQALGGLALQVAPLGVAMWSEPNLQAAMASIVGVRMVMLAALWAMHLPQRKLAMPRSSNSRELRRLLGFGGWTTVSATVGPLMVVLDRFVIGQQLGLKVVPIYAIPFQLVEKTTLLAAATNQALFPRLVAAATHAQQQAQAISAFQAIALIGAPFVALAMVVCGPFLEWWLPPDIGNRGVVLAKILLFGFWFNGLALVPLTLLYASGRPAAVARCHMAELLPYLVMLVIAVQYLGLEGAALAFAVRALFDLVLLSAAASMLGRAVLILIPPTLALAAMSAATTLLPVTAPTGAVLAALLVAALAAYGWWRLRKFQGVE